MLICERFRSISNKSCAPLFAFSCCIGQNHSFLDLEAVDELLSFRNIHRIVTDTNDVRKKTATMEEDRLLNAYNNAEFSDIFAQQRDKTLSVRAQFAEIMDDISVELHPANTDGNVNSQRKLFLRESQADLDHISHPKLQSDVDTFLNLGSGQTRKKKSQRPPATWERDYGSLFLG
ncbi:hypothetical protein P879_02033 [Paragonimus westermani]|uniref:Uncharacterized protein n=1 Tax=Paragonimus westermani TaxID=34504 RepID=A0A8T0DA10_9TREM|nr:hypothetical protein P879_02033 [Paragonimus westermani]